MALSDTFCKNTKWSGKPAGDKHSDGGGLYLHIKEAGRYWRLAYRMHGKQKTLALGVYPEIGLKDARENADKARKLLAQGQDPGEAKRADKIRRRISAETSFEAVAREWSKKHLANKAEIHRKKVVRRLERDVFPYIGTRPVADVTAPEILALARRVEARGTLETAHRVIQNIGRVTALAGA